MCVVNVVYWGVEIYCDGFLCHALVLYLCHYLAWVSSRLSSVMAIICWRMSPMFSCGWPRFWCVTMASGSPALCWDSPVGPVCAGIRWPLSPIRPMWLWSYVWKKGEVEWWGLQRESAVQLSVLRLQTEKMKKGVASDRMMIFINTWGESLPFFFNNRVKISQLWVCRLWFFFAMRGYSSPATVWLWWLCVEWTVPGKTLRKLEELQEVNKKYCWWSHKERGSEVSNTAVTITQTGVGLQSKLSPASNDTILFSPPELHPPGSVQCFHTAACVPYNGAQSRFLSCCSTPLWETPHGAVGYYPLSRHTRLVQVTSAQGFQINSIG